MGIAWTVGITSIQTGKISKCLKKTKLLSASSGTNFYGKEPKEITILSLLFVGLKLVLLVMATTVICHLNFMKCRLILILISFLNNALVTLAK